MRNLILVSMLALVSPPGFVYAQDAGETVSDTQASPDDRAIQQASGMPFVARASVDSTMPIVYGDDIVVSLLMTAQAGIDISAVRMRPKGVLRALYEDGSEAKTTGEEVSADGVDCPVGSGNLAEGRSIVITCRLTGKAVGWKRWFDWNALLDARSAQVEIEVELRDGLEDTPKYYQYVSADFVSPKAHVILGGFFGAALWALFLALPLATPSVANAERIGWKSMLKKIARSFPDLLARYGIGAGGVLRRALLGGLTALVLIVVAKGTEGLQPPISVRIQDFWGGMMIGILSTPLGKV